MAGGRGLVPASAGLLALSANAYLLMVLAGAWTAGRQPPPTPQRRPGARFLVLVPAHDEEGLIEDTVHSIARLDYPEDLTELVVIADHCADRTAAVAARAGASVLERHEGARTGKGAALAWALERLDAGDGYDAVVFVDADCRVSPNLLRAFAARIDRGARAVQAAYLADDPDASPASALRYAAFLLMNRVRPQGRAALGASCGLLGSGYALHTSLLAESPWDAFSLVEDVEYHAKLAASGERVEFAREACVHAMAAPSREQALTQNLRWEKGRWEVAARWVPALVRAGLRRRDARPLLTALDLAIPPQSLLLAMGAMAAVAPAGAGRRPRALGLASLGAQTTYVVGGLALSRAPRSVFRALAAAPALAAWKVGVHARLLLGRGPETWVGTRAAEGRS